MLLYRRISSVFRSEDSGETGQAVIEGDAYSDPFLAPSGTLLVGTRGNQDGQGSLALRSTDQGVTWDFAGLGDGVGIGTFGFVAVPAGAPPDGPVPDGRVVAFGFNGLAFSDDDGQTWTATALHGPLAFIAESAVLLPQTGRLLAVVSSNAGPTALYGSSDGGATWAVVGPSPVGGGSGRLIAVPDGALYAYTASVEDLPVWRSSDGGVTWENVGPVWTEWSASPERIVLGPQGRLWAGTRRESAAGPGVPRGGVFRTLGPVYAVSSEGGPEPGLALSVFPNPSGDAVTVRLGGASAEAGRLVVIDVRGRIVQTVALAPGARSVTVDVSDLAAGVYGVRAEVDGVGAPGRLTVVR